MSETNQNAKLDEEPKVNPTAEEESAEEKEQKQEASDTQTAEAAQEELQPETEEKQSEAGQKQPEEPDYQKQIAELEDRYVRKLAEFDNYRKRMARDFNETREATRRSTIGDFLTVYDYFSMGMAAIKTAKDIATLQQGMEMIWAEFQRVLEGFNVKEIESVGKPFDANLHEAVSQEPSETVPEGIVIRQWKAGFKIGDKLLRPAVVVVSSGQPKSEEPAEAEAPKSEEAPKMEEGASAEEPPKAE